MKGYYVLIIAALLAGCTDAKMARLAMELTLHGGNNKDNNANAKLIASAPDLYAVLSELEESAEYWSEYDAPLGIADRIKSVLAKARGGE